MTRFLLFIIYMACCFGAYCDTIFISSISELQSIGTDPSKPLDGNYQLSNNIDASVTSTWNSGAGWAPIGNLSSPFTGTFDGNGFAIESLFINRAAGDNVGLFGRVSPNAGFTAIIENLSVIGANIKGRSNTGIIIGGAEAGWPYNGNILVSGCFVSGSVEAVNSGENVGAIAGLSNRAAFVDCYSQATVKGFYNTGGLVGRCGSSFNSGASILRSYSTSAVTGTYAVGGVAGRITGGYIQDCYAAGMIEGGSNWSDFSGGLVGFVDNSSSAVYNCYFSGDVADKGKAAAFIGRNDGTAQDCFYCIDNITSESLKTKPVNQGSSLGIEGKTTQQMMQLATFSGWDIALLDSFIDESWWIIEGQSFPHLFYETIGASITLTAPADLESLRSGTVEFAATVDSGSDTIIGITLNIDGVEHETSILSVQGEYQWQMVVRGLTEGVHQWYISVVSEGSVGEIESISQTRSFELDFSLPPQPVYYTPEQTPTMVIIDDDGAEGVYTKLLPVANEYDVPLSPAILIKYDVNEPSIAPVIPEWGWASMTMANVDQMNQAGHSIISHGTMHTSHGIIISANPFVAGSTTLDGGGLFNGRFSNLHGQTNAQRGLTGIEVEIWEASNESLRETVYITAGGRYSRYDSSNPASPTGWDIYPVNISAPLVNSYSNPVATMSVAETERICQEVHAAFAAAGLPAPRHYVFPFNEAPPEPQMNKLLEYFDTLHSDNGLKVYYPPLREGGQAPFLLTRELIDGVTDQQQMDDIIDDIISYNGLGFVYLHADYGGTPLFDYIIEQAVTRGVRIMGFSDAWSIFRYKLTNIYPALNQQVATQSNSVELSVDISESTEADAIQVEFWDVTDPNHPALIDTKLISSGQTATADFAVTDNNSYQWNAQISILTQSGEVSVFTTETHKFNTIINPPSDINNDGTIDEYDLLIVASDWLEQLQPEQSLSADVNSDGIVNLSDFAVIASDWLNELL